VTRDTNSDKAKELAGLGAELVQADVDDPASVNKALEGAYGAYFVTFFWAHFSAEKEIAEARICERPAAVCNMPSGHAEEQGNLSIKR
jgi:uncharacterized protein YbjT (DUF2867 family)